MADDPNTGMTPEEIEQLAAQEAAMAGVAAAAENVAVAATAAAPRAASNMDLILDVPLQVAVEVGRARMTIQGLLQLGAGSVVELEKLAGESLDIFVNGKPVARGEAVIINEKFGVRITDIIPQNDRAQGLV